MFLQPSKLEEMRKKGEEFRRNWIKEKRKEKRRKKRLGEKLDESTKKKHKQKT